MDSFPELRYVLLRAVLTDDGRGTSYECLELVCRKPQVQRHIHAVAIAAQHVRRKRGGHSDGKQHQIFGAVEHDVILSWWECEQFTRFRHEEAPANAEDGRTRHDEIEF